MSKKTKNDTGTQSEYKKILREKYEKSDEQTKAKMRLLYSIEQR
jgi:hypothetical protein